ncbi:MULTISPECIES: nickel/cobalt transporter [Mesorhizobium]|uniref:Nickel/cobalt efflux system n=1 Tax=Mesorhizobium denitrificans TaxID=2294114 RepID=A0A371XE14_9HYPH|nr:MULTISPECIES: nickel/cobalt transporter [Mesorhizobium]RFC67452.1 delayed-early response protein/equilibrative nucleoside transporter [Mesorhizobium denitrificans]
MSRPRLIVATQVVLLTLAFCGIAHAQSSLGIGTNDAITPSTGLFAGWMQWINTYQQQFYRSLTGALKAMRDDGGKMWLLVGLSFAYGVFHAAGPGHGKAVISSYMLANEVALRRGILLSFVSAFLQGATALVMMGLVFLILRETSFSMTDATWSLEIASYAMITLFGAWLLWKKAAPRVKGMFGGRPAVSLSSAQNHVHSAACVHPVSSGFVCESCGHSHAPDPAMISGERFDWRTAWAAVAAVGLRPCTGAIIVLSFAFLNELWLGGILSVLAMSMGTAITVSMLAILAVTAKNWAVSAAGDGRVGNTVHAAIEIGGAAFVMLLGLLLLTASLSA